MTKKKSKRRANNYRMNNKGKITGHGGWGYGAKKHSMFKRLLKTIDIEI